MYDDELLEYLKPINVLSNQVFRNQKRHNQLKTFSGYQSFKSISEYQSLIFPLIQNEQYQSLKSEEKRYYKSLNNRNSFPIVFEIILNDEENPKIKDSIKFDVLKEHEEMRNQSPSNEEYWKYSHFAQYLIFKQCTQYFGAIYTPKPDNSNEYFSSLAIYSKKKDEKSILLPYSAANMFKFQNIFTSHQKLIDYKYQIIEFEKQNQNRHQQYERIWDQTLLVYFQPICPLSAYLNETNTVSQLSRCPYYQLLLNPCTKLNYVDPSDFCYKAKQQQELYFRNDIYRNHFNVNQLDAIQEALDFTKKITIIEGPPGTGKTQTTIGILAIISELLIKSDNNSQGAIMVLAKSNSVVNDLVRKFHDNIQNQNSIIYCFDRKPDYLKIVRFGRPEKCDSDIYRMSLEIRSQNYFFQQKFKKLVGEYESKYVSASILKKIEKKQLDSFRVYLQKTNQYYTLISLLNYIEELNLKTNNKVILNAYGDLYSSLSQLLTNNQSIYSDIEWDYLNQCHIIVSTLNSCSKKCLETYFEKVKFRMCIIDEAPTALEPSLLIPFVKYPTIEKIVLLGDTKQLNPIVIAKESIKYGYSRSQFQRLATGLKQNSYQLEYQYRQIPNLAEITSPIFYKGSLINGIQNMYLTDWIRSKVSSNRNRLFFSAPPYTESDEGTSKKNDLECQAIIQLVKYLLNGLTEAYAVQKLKPITILSGYRAQIENISQKIKQETFELISQQQDVRKEKIMDYIEIDTVDSFQGKENDIIILSLVRSNNKIGFLSDNQRANVALSRAKYCQFIFGTDKTMKQGLKTWAKIIRLLEKNKEIIKYDSESLKDGNFFSTQLNKY